MVLTVLIVDDDERVRDQALKVLARTDIKLASASNGRLALEQAMLLKPDIVICDVDLPEVNGFDVLTALKADDSFASTQVMMLTANGSRLGMRLGMSLGADDYLTKPFTDAELIDAVDGLIKRRDRMETRDNGVRQQEESLRGMFSREIAGATHSPRSGQNTQARERTLQDAAVLSTDIRGFTKIAEKLSAQDVTKLLAEYFERVCEPIMAHGGQSLKLLGDGLVAVFAHSAHAGSPSRRALLAATEMAVITRELGAWMPLAFPETKLPPLVAGYGVHCGDVAVMQAEAGVDVAPMPAGEAVDVALRLGRAGAELGWIIVASSTTLAKAGAGVRTGAVAVVAVSAGATNIEVSEVLDVVHQPNEEEQMAAAMSINTGSSRETTLDLGVGGTPTVRMRLTPEVSMRLRSDAVEHAGMAARAVKDALAGKLDELRSGKDASDAPAPRLEGFRILRRLGSGSMSTVHLARRDDTQDLVVLKVMRIDPKAQELTARFMREFSLLSTLSHPNIVRIYNQGFSGDSAYIAMEYFENGDLRSRMGHPLPVSQVIDVTVQTARALGTIHRMGIVHRDLKPENLMVRANGDVVLADFGIAKASGHEHGPQPTLTLMGELLGSPSYMSPEQVAGDPVTSRSDLYALGVMLYEMATGSRPYKGGSLLEVLAQHAKAPPPQLPAALQFLQPVLDRLMAKRPAARYADSDELIAALESIKKELQPAPQQHPS